jgi:hypothetical protein
MTLLANATKRGMQQGDRRMNRLAKCIVGAGLAPALFLYTPIRNHSTHVKKEVTYAAI